MSNMLKLSEAASLGLHAMSLIATADERLTTRRLAEALGASEHHLAKVMQRLHKSGLVRSTRGPAGGFDLARPARDITLLEVYETIEGPLGPARCLLGEPICDGKHCILGRLAYETQRMAQAHFENTTLADLARTIHLKEDVHV